MACQARCRAVLSRAAVDGQTHYGLRAVRRTLSKVGARARAHRAPAACPRRPLRRPITVRLRLTATMGTRVIMARRTVRIAATRR